MITVGTDTYVTVSDANAYLSQKYLSSDERLVQWNALSESDKEVYLRNACDAINSVKYRGVTYVALQKLAFPRYFGEQYAMAYRTLIAPLAYLYPELEDVPNEVVAAQCEEALEIACPSEDTATHEAVNGAVSHYSIGHLSETFKNVGDGSLEANVRSNKARKLLEQYAEGSYDII